jgi:two-component system phosphate regulon sensor histidine kinase PhoR
MLRSLMFWRLLASYSLLLLAAICLLGVVIVRRVEHYNLQQVEKNLLAEATLVGEMMRDRELAGASQLQLRLQAIQQKIPTRITLVAQDGRVLADTAEDPEQMENHADRWEFQAAQQFGIGTATRYSSTLDQGMMYLARRHDDASSPVAFVRVALPLDLVAEQSTWLRRVVGSTAGMTGLGALVLALWLARRITRPLRELMESSQRIAQGDYGHKVYADARDETGELGRAFNAMSQSLAAQFAQIAQDREQLRMILSGMVEGVVALDAQQQILFANERAGELLEFDPEAATGRKLWEVVRQRSLHDVVGRAMSEPEACRQELHFTTPASRTVMVHAARLPGAPARGAVIVLHDTSELRRLEVLRRDFVANVSHELKTPLAVIKACVETLLDGVVDTPEHQQAFLQRIAEQSDRLHALIIDLLSLARIESGKEAFHFRPVPVEAVVQACLERHRARAKSNQQELKAVAPDPRPEEPATVWADEEAVYQILDNLVDNALKYTPPGGRICVQWRATPQDVCVQVIDNGIGIAEQDLPRIFERFYRVDKARSRALQGTGLGLSIVKHLVLAMRGQVEVASTPGQGTTFTLHLPRSAT